MLQPAGSTGRAVQNCNVWLIGQELASSSSCSSGCSSSHVPSEARRKTHWWRYTTTTYSQLTLSQQTVATSSRSFKLNLLICGLVHALTPHKSGTGNACLNSDVPDLDNQGILLSRCCCSLVFPAQVAFRVQSWLCLPQAPREYLDQWEVQWQGVCWILLSSCQLHGLPGFEEGDSSVTVVNPCIQDLVRPRLELKGVIKVKPAESMMLYTTPTWMNQYQTS